MWLYWLSSKAIRNAIETCRHVEKITNAQRDLVPANGIGEVEAAIAAIRAAVRARKPKQAIAELIGKLDVVANKWLKPYPYGAWRENVEVVLVAIAVALAIRTFFLQPFKIPTGSMQPTLYGITHEDFRNQPEVKFPGLVQSFLDYWLRGISYIHIVAEEDGVLRDFEQPKTIFPFVHRQRLLVQGDRQDRYYTIWFAPEELIRHAGLHPGQPFRRGEDILKLKVYTGDHLFVDRVSYNFRKPKRGEIVVFETLGIPEEERDRNGIPGDQFYIKRLVGLGGESVSIGADRHLRINGVRLDASTPHFENVYSFDPKAPPEDSKYSGHVNGRTGRLGLAPLFPDEKTVHVIKPKHYMVMGDNTMNSLDSRTWGEFPEKFAIGKYCFVYWPILGKDANSSSRFGWSVR